MAKFRVRIPDTEWEAAYSVKKASLSLGRSSDNDIVIPDHTVSRHHAHLRKTKSGYEIVDLGSQNRLFMGNEPVEQRLLKDGDVLRIGRALLEWGPPPPETDASGEPAPKPMAAKAEIPETAGGLPVVLEDETAVELAVVPDAGIPDDSALIEAIRKGGGAAAEDAGRRDTLEWNNRMLYAMYRISRQLNQTTEFDRLAETILDVAVQSVDADYGYVAVLEPETGRILPKAVWYRSLPEGGKREFRFNRVVGRRVINDGLSILLTGQSAEHGQTDDSESPKLFMKSRRTVLTVPLWRNNRAVGWIRTDCFRISNVFTKADLELLAAVSRRTAMLIDEARWMDRHSDR